MRTFIRAAMVFSFVFASIVGPISAATTGATTVGQASQQGTITGKVTDQAGNGLGGALITAVGAGTRVTATSGDDGSFSLAVPPGVYAVTVNKGGFQSAENDGITVADSSPVNLTVALNEANLQSLQVIGRVSTTTGNNHAPFNISESSVSILPPQEITLRENNNLTDTIATIPGVIAERTFTSTVNTNLVVRGLPLQTKVEINGHPVSNGIVGQWNSNYLASGIITNVEVLKGAGLNGATAGESAVGTINLLTRPFSNTNSAGFQLGGDQYSGSFYNFWADVNLLPQNRLSLIVAKTYNGFNGPWGGMYEDRIGKISTISPGHDFPQNNLGLDQWIGDFSNGYGLAAENVKLRYKFSETTSLTMEYLGAQGQYSPQGGSYGVYVGPTTIQGCQNGSTFQATLNAACTSQSTYNAPYATGQIGTTVPGYTWFPNSYIKNNEPQFDAELRTAVGNDTLLLRPYTHVIYRYISGVAENQFPGNSSTPSGFFPVTNIANCQAMFLAPGAKGGPANGAVGPCFSNSMQPNSPSYVGPVQGGTTFPTTAVAPNGGTCSTVAPFTCWTTGTSIENDGLLGYGTPFSQPEFDQLNGYTFSWIHPMGNNILNFSYDYHKDFTSSASTDQTQAAAGCSFVIGSVSGTGVLGNGGVPFQPGCSTAQIPQASPFASYNLLPRSAIGTPPTVETVSDIALTGTFQLTDKLRVALGNYFEIWRLNAQIENPAVLNQFAALGNSAAAPVALIPGNSSYSHYDPHFGLEYRVNPNTSVRASAGSSITEPYAGIVSGFGSISVPNAAQPNYVQSIPNFSLKPETTVAYDLGFDTRLPDGGVLSMDAYDDTVHNVFLTSTTFIAPIAGITPFPGFTGTGFQQNNTYNGPIQRAYGLEAALTRIPTVGWGYYMSASLNRNFYDQVPKSFYLANTTPSSGNFIINGAQVFGNPFFKGYFQVLYNGLHGMTAALGMDWEGQDNSNFGPPYQLYDAELRVPFKNVPNLHALVSVQNLFNYNNGTNLARTLSAQGWIEPTTYINNLGVLRPSGSAVGLQAVPPRDIRFSMSYDLP